MKDENEIAKSVVDKATRKKNPHAVALGRAGGLKGGHARAKALTAVERSNIASKAVRARWEKDKK